jgi:polygalacturonase
MIAMMRRQPRMTVSSSTQNTNENSTRAATTSHGPVGTSSRKYSGSTPHSRYAPPAYATPAALVLAGASGVTDSP